MVKALYGLKPEGMADIDWKELEAKAVATIRLCLGDDVMYHVMDEAVFLIIHDLSLHQLVSEPSLFPWRQSQREGVTALHTWRT
jgi:hypothetical protein